MIEQIYVSERLFSSGLDLPHDHRLTPDVQNSGAACHQPLSLYYFMSLSSRHCLTREEPVRGLAGGRVV